MRSILSESFLRMAEAQSVFSHANKQAWPERTEIRINTASHRFLFSNFRYYFTLFSKFFSSFPHGTCSLSVSHPYLALDGIYHPLRAAIPNNSTRWKPTVPAHHRHERGFYPPWRGFHIDFIDGIQGSHAFYRLQFRRFSVWALSASLAVTREILVSFFSSA